MNYYELNPALDAATHWFLAKPIDAAGQVLDPRMFNDAKPVSVKAPLQIPVKKMGMSADFTFGSFMMPVVKPHVAQIVESIAPQAVQRIPAIIQDDDYEVLNVVLSIDCVDEDQTLVQYHTRGDPGRKYDMLARKIIDEAKARGQHIFRLANWEISLIVSEIVRDRFAQAGVTGISYTPVTK
jgi:hypothetical protein